MISTSPSPSTSRITISLGQAISARIIDCVHVLKSSLIMLKTATAPSAVENEPKWAPETDVTIISFAKSPSRSPTRRNEAPLNPDRIGIGSGHLRCDTGHRVALKLIARCLDHLQSSQNRFCGIFLLRRDRQAMSWRLCCRTHTSRRHSQQTPQTAQHPCHRSCCRLPD